MDNKFDDIRPYYDSEIAEAMRAVAQWDTFPQVARFIYPDISVEESMRRVLSIKTIQQLQTTFMNDAIKRIIENFTDGFTCSGLGNLRRGAPYLFISNHRDIALDAFLLQHVLIESGRDTSYVVFGNNLLSLPIIEVLFRSNKLIKMERGGSPREFYNSLKHLSEYLNELIVNQHHSVWIAQKNGRSKDGIDSTAPAIIKMLMLGSDLKSEDALDSLHIVPVSISYEWDPCDVMKANELLKSRDGKYQKAPDEDLRSVVTGIIGPKGKVHLTIGTPLSRRELQAPEGVDIADHVAAILDNKIQHGYQLMPTNYVAYSMLTGQNVTGRFKISTKNRFATHIEAQPDPEIRKILLEMYANPVISMRKRGRQS